MRNRLKISILYNKINLKISKIQILTNYINWIKRQLIKNNFQIPKIWIIVINKRAVFFEIDAPYDTFKLLWTALSIIWPAWDRCICFHEENGFTCMYMQMLQSPSQGYCYLQLQLTGRWPVSHCIIVVLWMSFRMITKCESSKALLYMMPLESPKYF